MGGGGGLHEASECVEKSGPSFVFLVPASRGGNKSETCAGSNKNLLMFCDTLRLHATDAGIKAGAAPQIMFQIKPT